MQIALWALLVATSSSTVLRGQPEKQAAVAAPKAAPKVVAAAVAAPKVAPKVVAAPKAKDDTETLEALGKGLQTINNLRSLFTKDKTASAVDHGEKFANGALSEELSNKDSQVWSTIETMIGATQNAMKAVKGKDKAERAKVMASLEDQLNDKAAVLGNVNDNVSKKQQQQDEEYLLGLLNMHRKDWSVEKQLNATETFMHNSPVLRNFYEHHDASKPLVPQLAALMDAARKAAPKAAPVAPKAAPVVEKKTAEKKKAVGKAASAAAKALFIQLASTVTNQDCPYCAAQCVDKCHTAGKPYVQCLTDCADAGK